MNSQNTYISVVIPTCNRNDLLHQCLNALIPSISSFVKDCEVIITDDSINNGAKQVIEGKPSFVKWIAGPKKGPAANRNNGAKLAKGKWIVFLDDDCIPDNNILNSYSIGITNFPQYYIFEGRIYTNGLKNTMDEESPINESGGFLWSCNFCINKDVFFQIDGFDENFPYAAQEDTDLRMRLEKQNFKIKFLYDASVIHPWRKIGGWRTLIKKRKSFEYLVLKHPNELKKFKSMSYRFNLFLKVLARFLREVWDFKGKGFVKAGQVVFFRFCMIFKPFK